MVRRDNRTVISMANDYKGELTDFALVVPVPTVLERSQIRIGDRKLFERIDSYSAPRLAEYFRPRSLSPAKKRRDQRADRGALRRGRQRHWKVSVTRCSA
jgi:hypothetical protein